MKRAVLLLAFSALAACHVGRTVNAAEYAVPRFDWFEYRGSDSIYAITPRTEQQFYNPILPGFYPDPSIAGLNGDYYLVNSSFAYFPGVPLFHSRDLTHWTQIGSVLDRRSQLNLDSAGMSRGLYAPTIRYNAGNATWYMITTLVDRGGNFYVTARNPAGPWSDPVWLREIDGIDPSFFFDDNGKAYVVNNGPPIGTPRYNGHRAIWIQEFDVASGKVTGPRSLIVNGGVDLSKNPIWIEAPHIFKRNGLYYLICAEGGTADQHSEVVFRSDKPMGPYASFVGNPILTQRHLGEQRPYPVTSTGHADFVQAANGQWWAVFLGTRPYALDTYNTGRETYMLPVKWVNDWPVILTGNDIVPYALAGPAMQGEARTSLSGGQYVMGSGNFTVRDDFNERTLPLYWQTIRGPAGSWLDLTSSPGALTLVPRAAGFEAASQPSFVARRQQHLNATVTTAVRYVPPRIGDKAGLVAFQNDEFYFFLAVARSDSGVVVEVERHGNRRGAAAADRVLAAHVIDKAPDAPVLLRMQSHGGSYDFAYSVRDGVWVNLVTGADGSILSTKVAGGFVGTMVGLYAYSPAGTR